MRDILLLICTGGVSLSALARPVFGILAYIAYSFLAPHSYTWGIARSFPHVQVIAICTLAGYAFWTEPRRFPRQREFAMFLALWVDFAFTTILAIYPDQAFDELIHISKILLMIVVCMSLINTEERLHLLAKVISLSIGFYALKGGLYVIRTGGVAAIEGPDNSYLQANNALGMALAMNVPLLFYLAKLETNKWVRWLFRVMLVLSYPAVAGTFTRGAWLALALITGLLVVKSKSAKTKAISVVVLFLAILVLIPMLSSEQMASRFSTVNNLDEDNSAQSRLWSWTFCSKVGLELPLTGAGFNYYSFETYAKFYPEIVQRWPGKLWSCHNMWLTIWGEHGVVGFLMWGGLLLFCFISLKNIKQFGMGHEAQNWMVSYAEMIKMSLIAYMVCGTFVDIAYFELYYFLAAIVILLNERIRITSIDSVVQKLMYTNGQVPSGQTEPLCAR